MTRSSPESSAPAPSATLQPEAVTEAEQVRLELKPHTTRDGHVDGGWWPRSRDLRAELPGLLDALTARLGSAFGPVLRVGFGIGEWGPVSRGRLVTAAGRVGFGGFTTLAADVIWLSGHATARAPIVLLVVPPETAEPRATSALHRAGLAGNTERPAELLGDRSPTSGVDSAPGGA